METLVAYTTGTIQQIDQLTALGMAADHHAAQNAFADYRGRKANKTVEAQKFDLMCFAQYRDEALGERLIGTEADRKQDLLQKADALQTGADAWHGVTWGIVEGFVKWMLRAGYSTGTINRRLSTVKIYARLAAKSGVIDMQSLGLIRLVNGYAGKEAKRIDEKRPVTRIGHKKERHVSLTHAQAKELKTQPDTPQGRRDAVIMALLLDLGLRVGELAILQVANIDLKAGLIQIKRPKVNLEQTHELRADSIKALRNWIDSGDCAPFGPLLRGSRKGGHLTDCGMSTTSITERVRTLGNEIGVSGLSAHDCRHYWTTRQVNVKGADLNQIRQAGGWSTLDMLMRYVEASAIANEGLI